MKGLRKETIALLLSLNIINLSITQNTYANNNMLIDNFKDIF